MPTVNLAPPSDDVLYERIMAKVVITSSGCWEYMGARHKRTGHGMFGYTVQGKTTTLYVHVWMYKRLVGEVPEGLVLDHRVCDNPPCCNAWHLQPCTLGENTMRGNSPVAINARKTHCARARHPLSGDNLGINPTTGYRFCKACACDLQRGGRK